MDQHQKISMKDKILPRGNGSRLEGFPQILSPQEHGSQLYAMCGRHPASCQEPKNGHIYSDVL
ncbi:unnamed protein product [Prunus armeniaca]